MAEIAATCPCCGHLFTAHAPHAVFCSAVCRVRAHRRRQSAALALLERRLGAIARDDSAEAEAIDVEAAELLAV